MVFTTTGVRALKHLLARTCVFSLAVTASLLAIAQSLPVFGTARFGQAVFGEASVGTTGVGADALPVPFMPLWATITLAIALWVVAYLINLRRVEMIRPLLAFVALNFHAVAWADFDAGDCAQVAGTNAIHWRDAQGDYNFCEDIEYLDVTEELNGSFTLNGTSAAGNCVNLFNYSFTVAADGLSASGGDTDTPHDMPLTRSPGQACFVGRWTAAGEIWVAQIPKSIFNVRDPATPVPSLGLWQLGVLASLMGLAVWVRRRLSSI